MKTRGKLAIWAEKVKRRDEYECKICGAKKFLHAHHIVPRRKDKSLWYKVSNGLTLCRSCHAKTEGYQNGHGFSEETRRKISESKKGSPCWNKGKCWSDEVKKKLRESHLGQHPWNKGKKMPFESWLKGKKAPESIRKSLAEANRKKWEKWKREGHSGPRKGTKQSDEARRKVSESLKRAYAEGRRKKKPMSEETKRKISETKKKRRLNGSQTSQFAQS